MFCPYDNEEMYEVADNYFSCLQCGYCYYDFEVARTEEEHEIIAEGW